MPFLISYIVGILLCALLYHSVKKAEIDISWALNSDANKKWFVALWFIPTINYMLIIAMGILLLVNNKSFMEKVFKK